MKGSRSGKAQARPLVWRLVVLCGATTLPLFAVLAALLTEYTGAERKQLERGGLEAVRTIASALENDIASLNAILQTLSFSTRLADGDFAGFHRLASIVTRSTGLPVVLSDLKGQQVVNTRVPFGTPLPALNTSYREVFETRKPIVTGLFMGSVAQVPLYSLGTPVFAPDTDRVAHVLNFSIDPIRIRDALLAAGLGNHAFAGVIDRSGRMMARTVDHERFLGTVPEPFLRAVAGRSEGQARLVNRDGKRILASFTRMSSTGWIVAHGLPIEVIDEPMRSLVLLLAKIGVASIFLAGVGAFVFSRRLVASLSSLERSASDVGHGAIVEPVRTSVTEINKVGERIAQASHELRQTTDAKDALLYEVNHRVKNSLAVVTSLLSLQVRQTDDDSLRRGLEELRARIDVVASVHQQLYRSGRHDRLDLGPFLEDIARSMVKALCGEGCRLTTDCESGIILGVDRTTPLALIVGELLTNAIKHGRRDGEICGIALAVRRDADHVISVVVSDDGDGLPVNFSLVGSNGVGMRIVAGLLRQLRGRMATNAGARGARFTIMFDEVTK